VVSSALRDELVARGIPEDKILVNPNGVDPDVYSPQVDGSSVRRRFGLADKTVVGFIGTFGRWHGVEVLARAFASVLQQAPEYRSRLRLLLVGDGVCMPQVRRILEESGALSCCTLPGTVPQQEGPAYLAACDILVSPHVPNPDGSTFFGSPTKLFEYMAMAKPVVASRLGQIAEVLRHDETAWLVTPGQSEDLACGLREMVDNPDRRRRLGQAARAQILARHTWRHHTQRIVDKLQELAQRAG
jgi:glycosyltransferase involved in cell wall biosynthesis